jgi:predicted RNA binding protein with dsRBD fold (UPF0201 family)
MIAVEVSAHVNPTEDRDRVQSAIERIFNGLEYELQEREGFTTRLVGTGGRDSLEPLHELLRSRKILDTGRRNMHIEGSTVTFTLNKQAATVGKVSFPAGDEPLGSIWVEIVTQDADEAGRLVDWLAPPTKNGHPEFEIEL